MMSIDAILEKTWRMWNEERARYYPSPEDRYEWVISYDLGSAIERRALREGYRFDEPLMLYNIPVRIEYEKTNTIELWKKVG